MKIIRQENYIINLVEVRNIDSRISDNEAQIFFFFKNIKEYQCIKIPKNLANLLTNVMKL